MEAARDPAAYGVPQHHFEYCELDTVAAESDPTGALAALTAVMNYWDLEATEQELANRHPATSAHRNVRRLRRIAIDEGLTAFALAMGDNGLAQLGEHLQNGRPVIVPLDTADANAPADAPEANRFVVVFGQSESEFLLMDPAEASVVRIPKQDFESLWAAKKHAALICSAS